ncbi:MAG: YihY/virulence factor BrkB family protein [Ferruginibacter sp.]
MKRITPRGLWEVLKNSFKGFIDDKVLKLSASLAYYTVFSLAPLLIVLLFICGKIFGTEAIEGSVYGQIEGFVGSESALQLQEIVKNASISDKSNVAAVIGIITLLIGATSVFAEIQDSINSIWGLKPKPGKGIKLFLKTRLASFGVIGSLGFLLLVSLGVTAIVEALSNRLKDNFPDVTVVVFYILNILITFIITSSLFAVIFKVLPDAKIKYKDVIAGAIATTLLFMLGKFGISFYISKSEVGSTYGAAGSLVVLLVWIYYSSVILYFGAEFTKAYAMKYGSPIHPNHYAVTTRTVEVEECDDTVQQTVKKETKEQAKVDVENEKK